MLKTYLSKVIVQLIITEALNPNDILLYNFANNANQEEEMNMPQFEEYFNLIAQVLILLKAEYEGSWADVVKFYRSSGL